METNSPLTKYDNFQKLRENQIVTEMGSIFSVISNSMVIPLFLLFWLADILYMPHLKWETLALRLTVIPLVLFCKLVLSKPRSYNYLQLTMCLYSFCCASVVTAIIFLQGDPQTGYYAGLNLIALGTLSFVPFRLRYLFVCASTIYIPYFIVVLHQASSAEDFKQIAIHSFFIVGTLSICGVIHYFNESLRQTDLKSRIGLIEEVQERQHIIDKKTSEATQLRQLSTQFSPQVVDAIQRGRFSLNKKAELRKICVVFIDVVGSTEKVNSLAPEKFQNVIEQFLKISIESFLKYDLTIDKFQGDGILAFSNSPVEHADFVDRVCLAVFEVRTKFELVRQQIENEWNGDFSIRKGIAVGTANVGFFGDRKNYNSFTAIGRPMALAARICAAAHPNQILLDRESAFSLPKDQFQVKSVGSKLFKGFFAEEIECFDLVSKFSRLETPNESVCPLHPDRPLKINLEDQVLECLECGFKHKTTEIEDYSLDEDFLARIGKVKNK